MSKRAKRRSLLSTLDDVFGPTERLPVDSPKEAAMFINPPTEEDYACESDRRLPRCEYGDKVCFPSKNSAKNALRLRQRRGAGFLRVYWCEHCHSHHLTSMRFEKS